VEPITNKLLFVRMNGNYMITPGPRRSERCETVCPKLVGMKYQPDPFRHALSTHPNEGPGFGQEISARNHPDRQPLLYRIFNNRPVVEKAKRHIASRSLQGPNEHFCRVACPTS
jgi:hypothetical protein